MTRVQWRDRVEAIRRPIRGAWYRVGRRRDRIVDAVVRRKDGVVYRVGDRRDRIVDAVVRRKDGVVYRVGDRRHRIVRAVAARKDGALDRIDDAWYSLNDRVPHTRRILGGAAALAGIVSAVVLWSFVLSGVTGQTAGTGSDRLPVSAPSDPANGDAGSPATTAPSPTSPTTSGTGSTGGLTAAAAPIEMIELVPPLRDVIVVVDGVELVSDARGAIAVPDALRRGTFTFVGVREQPALRQVTFARWSDGDPSDDRSLGDVSGPVAVIGVVEQRRVTIWTNIETPSGTEVRFDTQAGPVGLPVGTATWVDAERAVDAGGALAPEELRYTAAEVLLDGTNRSIPSQVFSPTPEALWVVDVSEVANPATEPASGLP